MEPHDRLQDSVAIIGIGCRFPGGVVDPETFWQLLANGVDAIGDIPADRFDIDRFHDPRPGTPGRITPRSGGFVEQALEDFDAAFFGISRSYAERLDPQQRLLLETAWEAMEDAGLDIVGMQGSPTGVFVGQWVSDYEHRLFANRDDISFQMTMGSGRYAAAGRISYAFGFRGASLSIDAACSSGLASVHLAVRSLRNGDSAVALAGGVNIILEPHIHLAYSSSKMLAADGRCRFGDEAGSGYVRSEGAGMVVLKPLAAALADGNHVYAVIRGTAVNNDGNSSGVMGRPSAIGQAELIRSALRDGQVRASQLQYVEAHGTGTRAGDPVELGALGAVLSEGRPLDVAPTWVGSVKTNFGHTEAAAGVAGLIKVALMLERGAIPPSLHFAKPNPEVPWESLPIAIPTTLMPWPVGVAAGRFAGVSSYGIGGTNAHAVLESAPVGQLHQEPATATAGLPLLLLLSARSAAALRAMAARYAERLGLPDADARAICFCAATRRSALPHRAAFVAADHAVLLAQLEGYASGDAATATGIVHESTRRRVAFVLPGQGGQWVGMARLLFASNGPFRDTLLACDGAARKVVSWSIVEQLHMDVDAQGFIGNRIDVIQPALVAVALGYAAWLRSMGILPDAVVGHSLGEVGAAAIAGVIDAETAMRIICVRSALMLRTSGQGAMAVVDMPQAELAARLHASGAAVTVAVSNGPRSSVVSGAPADVRDLLAQLEAEAIFARLVKVDVASHGPQMEPLVPLLVEALRDIVPRRAELPIYSSVDASLSRGDEFDAAYWGRNLRQPVQFSRTVETMLADGISAFIELGPHAMLTYAITQTADALDESVCVIACGARDTDELQSITTVPATLWANGIEIDRRQVFQGGGALVPLPAYPWQRERFWFDTTVATRAALTAVTTAAHPFLGERIETAAGGGASEWVVRFNVDAAPWLLDHVVQGTAIVPAAALIDVMAAAVRETLGAGRDIELRDFVVSQAVPLRTGPELRLVVTQLAAALTLHLYAKEEADWHVVAAATGALAEAGWTLPVAAPGGDTPGEVLDAIVHYTRMHRRGLAYGAAFQVVRRLTVAGAAASAEVASAQEAQVARRIALLDGALQSLLALAPPIFASPHETIVPVGAQRIRIRSSAWSGAVIATASRSTATEAGVLTGELHVRDVAGAECIALDGVQMKVVRGTAAQSLAALRYRSIWTPVQLDPAAAPRAHWLVVHDAGGIGAQLAVRLRAAGHTVLDWSAESLSDQRALPRGTRHVVICTPLDAREDADPRGLDAALVCAYDAPLSVIQLAAASDEAPVSVMIVTSGAVALDELAAARAPLQGASWGLARVARHEHPSIGCVIIDAPVEALAEGLLGALVGAEDAELAWHDGKWWAGRFTRVHEDLPATAVATTETAFYTANVATPGVVDSIGWREAAPPALAAHEVLIAVAASGLNFLDLLVVLNAYPATEPGTVSAAPQLGLECAGVVVRVGSAVRKLSTGDRVMAVCEGGLASHVVAHEALVVCIPDSLSFEAASSFPLAFLTAARALEQVAGLRSGERVLIHSAAGGVGLAALQVARNCGAQVFATAGTDDKRKMLHGLGVQHVFDSRDLKWGDEVLAATNGAGVDVVLNSLSGGAIETGLRVLANYGRFVEIGKRDVFGETRIGLGAFRKQATMTSMYLLEQMRMDPASLGTLLHDLAARLVRGELTLLPATPFAADQVSDAFLAMVPGTHVGKMVVSHHTAPRSLRRGMSAARVRDDGAYLITGGLGALGRRAAAWLVSRGARHLLLAGRSAPNDDAQRAIEAWRAAGVRVETLATDVATEIGIERIRVALASLPPLRGVIHAAGALDDGLILEQTPARMRAIAAAKVGGAMQLATLPGLKAADFVVMYSSVAGALGTRGQANYAAANAILDAFASTLRGRGVHATSIGFGPFSGIGLATEGRRLDILADSGLGALRPAHADAAIDALAGSRSAHEVIAQFDPRRWLGVQASMPERRWLDVDVLSAGTLTSQPEAGIGERLAAIADRRQRSDIVLDLVKKEVAAVLRTSAERIEPLKPLRAMGIDSLTALELRNRLEQATGLRFPGTLVFNHPNPAAIALHVLERLTQQAPPAARDAAGPVSAQPDDEVESLVREMAGMDVDLLQHYLQEQGDGEDN